MSTWEHPLQLFGLEHPEEWDLQYQEETGGVMLLNAGLVGACALSLTPLAMTGGERPMEEQVREIAARVGVALPENRVETREEGETRWAYAEGTREDAISKQSRFRFWVIRHGSLALHAAQLGPGADLPRQREIADAILASIRFPEILPATPEEFVQRVMEVLAREYAPVQATRTGEWSLHLVDGQGAEIGTVSLENLYRECLLQAESAGALIRNHLNGVLGLFSEGAAPDEAETYASVCARILPMLRSEAWVSEIPQDMELATIPFAPGLVMCFAVDEPTHFSYISRARLAGWDVPLERLQEMAQDNLAARDENLQVTVLPGPDGQPVAVAVAAGDGYDASRFLLPNIRELFAEHLGEEYLVGIPNRDFLIAFSERIPEMAARITKQVEADYQRMSHPISPTVYRVTPASIQPV